MRAGRKRPPPQAKHRTPGPPHPPPPPLTPTRARRARDFSATISGAAAECGFRDRYGVLFRVQNGSNYYQFEVDCDARYRLSKVVEGAVKPLRDWAPVAAPHS